MNDKGRIVMNLGAIASLTGFMMSDVLHLRMHRYSEVVVYYVQFHEASHSSTEWRGECSLCVRICT